MLSTNLQEPAQSLVHVSLYIIISFFYPIVLLIHNYIEYSILLALIFNALVLFYIDVIFIGLNGLSLWLMKQS